MRATKVARVDNSEKSTLHDKLPLSTPYSIHIDVCSICNFKCNFCFQADTEGMDKMGLVRDRMDMAVFKKIADDLTAFPEKVRKVKIGLHGEPTLHPQLPEMVAYMKSKNVTDCIELFTNGSRLNPTLNKALADAGLNRVNISLEALTTERYREIAKAKIDMAKFNANVADLGTHRSIRLHIKIADQIGALALTEDEREFFYNTYGDMCDEIFIERVVPQWPDVAAVKLTRKGMYGQEIKQSKNACPFLFMYMHFNSDGSVAGCTLDWGRKVLIGNITKNTAREIWEGDQLNSLQVAHLEGRRCEIDVCDNCNAPMLCAKEDLDPHAKDILQLIRRAPAA